MYAQEVTRIRETLEMAPSDLARLLGVCERTVIRWETGEVAPSSTAVEVLDGLRQAADASSPAQRRRLAELIATTGGLSPLLRILLTDAAKLKRA